MDNNLKQINSKIYDNCSFELSDFSVEPEGAEYSPSRFTLNGLKMICRNSKVTPKKAGQFVTFWKRTNKGPIEPFHKSDAFDFFVVNSRVGENFGQFVFPKSVLVEKGIISTKLKEGKRAFRVYPKWDTVYSKQAERTQKWQLDFFYKIDESTDCNRVKELYKT